MIPTCRRVSLTAVGLLLACLIAQPAAGSFPGRNGKIALEIWYGVLGTVNPDGTAMRALCAPERRSGCSEEMHPSWSADGRHLAFSSDRASRTATHRIWEMRADGTARRRVTPNVFPETGVGNPAWSPDGSKVAFNFGLSGGDLYVVDADGTNVRRLTATDYVEEHSADWSPDGSMIAFTADYVSDEESTRRIEIMNADGTGRRRLLGAAGGVFPSWSPDGSRIAFWRSSSLFTVGIDGTGLRRLARVGSIPLAWSPDGTQIAFGRGGSVYIVGVDGSGLRRVVRRGSRYVTVESWQPVTCTITGTAGPDVLTGTPAPDIVCGGRGDDRIRGAGREDFLYGDGGDDVIYATGAGEIVQGGGGDDVLYGTPGRNTLEGGPGNDILYGRGGKDFLSGGPGKDRVSAGTGADHVLGEGGADAITVGRGDDVVGGGPGNDVIGGGGGNDQVFGGRGHDRVRGGPGRDAMTAGAGRDLVVGGSGSDRLVIRDGRRDFGHGGPGRDCAVFDLRLDEVRSAMDCRRRLAGKVDRSLPPKAAARAGRARALMRLRTIAARR